MQTVNNGPVVCYDVDNTLVAEIKTSPFVCEQVEAANYVLVPHPLRDYRCVQRKKMHKNIQLLRDMHARGRFIIVWSQAGSLWAEAVVKALNLENHVHLIIEKPIAYVDDLEANQFMGQRIFLND